MSDEISKVLTEKWLIREASHKGALIVCVPADRNTPGTPNAELRMQRIPAHLQNLVTERARIVAAAPAAVRLAREAALLIESMESDAKVSTGPIIAHARMYSRDYLLELGRLLSEVLASLEGRS